MPQVASVVSEQLCLFDLGGVDVGKLRIRRDQLSQVVSRSPVTLTCYRSDWRIYEAWCLAAGRVSLPSDADTLSLYVTAELERGLKVVTLRRKLNSIFWAHGAAGVAFPPNSQALAVLRGASRERREQPLGRVPVTLPVLLLVSRSLSGDDVADVRDRAIWLFGFASGLRRSELARLDLADVVVSREGASIYVAWSKTDQVGEGRRLGVCRAVRDLRLCPVDALQSWLRVRGAAPGPLFLRVSRGGAVMHRRLSGDAICAAVQRGLCRAGLSSSGYGAHSLRAGMITVAGASGASTLAIMKRSGHKSVAMVERYFRPDLFQADPLALAL